VLLWPLQAYKDFMRAMTSARNPDQKDDTTEELWREEWQAFWAAADRAPDSAKEAPEGGGNRAAQQ
jgi:hypothetical protein